MRSLKRLPLLMIAGILGSAVVTSLSYTQPESEGEDPQAVVQGKKEPLRRQERMEKRDRRREKRQEKLERLREKRKEKLERFHDRDNNPPGPRGGAGTNWENRPGPQGGPGAGPDRRHEHFNRGVRDHGRGEGRGGVGRGGEHRSPRSQGGVRGGGKRGR